MGYLLDANVFIEAKNAYYGFDFCPAFWSWLIDKHNAGIVFSVEKVGDEITPGQDELADWAKARGPEFFLPPDPSVLPSFHVLSSWASSGFYEQAAISTFLQVADYYLVAQAHAGKHIVVTREVPAASKRKIKIPDACIGLGVKVCDAF